MMNQANSQGSFLRPRAASGWGLALACLLAAPACNDSKSPGFSSNTAGTTLDHPGASSGTSKRFVVDLNRLGRASEVKVARMMWGRLVDVYDQDANGLRRLQHKEFVIGSDIVANGADYAFSSNVATAIDELTILHPHGGDDGIASPDDPYEVAFARLEQGLLPVQDEGIDGVGVFTLLPRNAALVIQFDDLIDPDTINARTIRVFAGYPPVVPYTARIFPDQNHGDLTSRAGDTGATFYPSRVIIDPTISEVESFNSDPPLAVNGVGLPASTSPNLANLAVRIPTEEKAGLGQDMVVRNLTAHRLAVQGNGTVDFNSPTLDILRGIRSGGRTLDTGDPYNGFLFDETPPKVISIQPVLIGAGVSLAADGDERDFLIPSTHFLTTSCAREPLVGDLMRQGNRFLQVTDAGDGLNLNVLENMEVRLIAGDPAEFLQSAQGAARYLATYDPDLDGTRPECFVQVTPQSGGFPDAPAVDISTSSSFSLRFSEVMDPDSMRAFDSLILQRVPENPTGVDRVVGRIETSVDVRQFTIFPDLPLNHEVGTGEPYYLALTEGQFGPTDLAGNSLADPFPVTEFTVDADLASQDNGGRVTRFSSVDEFPPFGNDIDGDLPEWGGAHTYDLEAQEIEPRPVVRFEAVVDRSQTIVQLMGSQASGVQVPLTKFGNKLHSIWRNGDMNLPIDDAASYDVDVERLSWAPLGGIAIADFFSRFEISMAHSRWHPDEVLDPCSGLPVWPGSGLRQTFDANLLDPTGDPLRVVHPRELGYTISPGDIFAASTGTLVLPYPLNRSIPVSEYNYYTWRDTGLRERAGFGGAGSETSLYRLNVKDVFWYNANAVASIGLPLLTEFKCFPDDQAQGLNVLDVAIAVTSSQRPTFRAFSSGGVDQSENVVNRDPDLESEANGGFNPLSNPPGQMTSGEDTVVYLGTLDLITRISRTYSIWFPVTGGGVGVMYRPPVLEPAPIEQPPGTRILVDFRGALAIDAAHQVVREDATIFDGYGDYYSDPQTRNLPNQEITFLDGTDQEWKSEASAIDGATFYQIRLTFESDPETGVGPVLSGLGLTWMRP